MTAKRPGLIYIKKRTFPQWLTFYIFLFPLFMSFLLDMLGLPGFLKYTVDAAWFLVMLSMVIRKRATMTRKYSPFIVFIGIFFLYTFIAYCFHFQSPIYYLWGLRNNFRFYIAFIAFAMLFEEEEAEKYLNFLDLLFWFNAAVSFYQFFVMGLNQDYLGGLFGVERGCNGYSLIFFTIVVGRSLLRFMNKQESSLLCFLKCGLSLIIAAMAELKVYFLIFVLLLGCSAILTKFSWRKFSVLALGAFFLFVGSTLLVEIFGESNRLSWERLIELITATNYATGEDLGRFTAIPTITRTILTDWHEQIFGLGLGNCDTSTFAICNTPFFRAHENLHYVWFSSAFWFLETGYVGLITYLAFFVLAFLKARKHLIQGTSKDQYCQLGMIMAMVCIILTFYNSSLRIEVAYLAFFALALPFMETKGKENV